MAAPRAVPPTFSNFLLPKLVLAKAALEKLKRDALMNFFNQRVTKISDRPAPGRGARAGGIHTGRRLKCITKLRENLNQTYLNNGNSPVPGAINHFFFFRIVHHFVCHETVAARWSDLWPLKRKIVGSNLSSNLSAYFFLSDITHYYI